MFFIEKRGRNVQGETETVNRDTQRINVQGEM